MKKTTLFFFVLICLSLCSLSFQLQAQSVSCTDAPNQTTVTIISSTPNGANFDYNLTLEVTGFLPGETYNFIYSGAGTLTGSPVSVTSGGGSVAATLTNVPNGTMGTFTSSGPPPLGCTTSSLTFNPVSGGSAASIPTLSEWGLILLALLLMTFGVLYQLQPRFKEIEQ